MTESGPIILNVLLALAALALVITAPAMLVVLMRMEAALSRIVWVLESGVVSVRDIERAKVYSEHLGAKLRHPDDTKKV